MTRGKSFIQCSIEPSVWEYGIQHSRRQAGWYVSRAESTDNVNSFNGALLEHVPDPPGINGLAHFNEHMLFLGTEVLLITTVSLFVDFCGIALEIGPHCFTSFSYYMLFLGTE